MKRLKRRFSFEREVVDRSFLSSFRPDGGSRTVEQFFLSEMKGLSVSSAQAATHDPWLVPTTWSPLRGHHCPLEDRPFPAHAIWYHIKFWSMMPRPLATLPAPYVSTSTFLFSGVSVFGAGTEDAPQSSQGQVRRQSTGRVGGVVAVYDDRGHTSRPRTIE